jgi:hypothetical protein
MELHRYRRKADQVVVAVQLKLDTSGIEYTKWGASQRCKAGDFIVDNQGDVYTVDADVFARTYRAVATGQYVKTTPIWAAQAAQAGGVKTKEGMTHYETGDYLVSNDEAGTDRYAVAREKFESMYERDQG